MLILSLKLLLAHIIGDFVLQPSKWVKEKQERSFKSVYFYLHGLVHLIALLILLHPLSEYWLVIILIVLSHLLIDLIKIKLNDKVDSRLLFFTDQLLHVTVIGLVIASFYPVQIDLDSIVTTKTLLLICSLLMVTFVSSTIIKVILGAWEMDEDKSNDSLLNAGKYIGMLERLFVFAFIMIDQISAIGFLIAAKSVFRFSDLSRAKDRKLTEYILIGTLLSFGLSILIGLIFRELVR